MQSYVQGDARAFDGLFARLKHSVHAFFVRHFRSSAVADDLLQLTFLKLHTSRADYNPELPFKPWLFAIAYRVRLDELRRRQRASDQGNETELARLADERADTASTAEQELLRLAEQKAVLAALARLPARQRVVIELNRLEDMKFTEIARRLGTTAVAVKLRAYRGYEQLREELRPVFEAYSGNLNGNVASVANAIDAESKCNAQNARNHRCAPDVFHLVDSSRSRATGNHTATGQEESTMETKHQNAQDEVMAAEGKGAEEFQVEIVDLREGDAEVDAEVVFFRSTTTTCTTC